MLDSAAAAGGGTVQLDARVYTVCEPLVVRSNVHLRGAGRGATILRDMPTSGCKTEQGASICATVGAAGATNVSVSGLTIDHRTYREEANAIVFVPAGALYDGQVPTNVSVHDVEILGASGFHNYMIWNFRGQHVKFHDNWVDGGSSANSDQEGIESYGGHDVVITNNTVRNIGSACVNIGSAGLPNTETVGISVANNYLENCQIGIHSGTSTGTGGEDEFNDDTNIRGNIITGSRLAGIDCWVMSGTHERNLDISHNTIRDVSAFDQAAGIRLLPNGPITADAVSNTTIDGNIIAGVHGGNAHGIRLWSYANTRVVSNTVSDVDHEGIFAVDTDHLEVSGNRIERVGAIGISVQKVSGNVTGLVIDDNSIADWGTQFAGVLVIGAHAGSVRDNTFRRADNVQTGPVGFDSSACGISVTGNLAWYLPGWQNASTASCP